LKIAFTADLHLTAGQMYPERYHALENIFQQMVEGRISTLIIAGDLFDETSRNYAEFDKLCSKNKDIKVLVIPGNHDSVLNQQEVTAANLEIYSEPKLQDFGGNAPPFLFLPFKKGKTMGEFISGFASELGENNWVLVGHGDWAEGYEPNPFEPGVYMPLTRSDLENFKPAQVFLGHIHKAMDKGKVHYIGSPCGLDIRETGRRRFLIFDTDAGKIEHRKVDSQVIFFNESLVILPVEDEADYIEKEIAERITSWDLEEEEIPKTQIKVKVYGYSSDKRKLMETIREAFREFTFYKSWEPDLTEVSVAEDINRAEISDRVSAWIDKLDWNTINNHPSKELILLQALKVIYED